MEEKENLTSSCAVERGHTEKAKAVRKRLIWVVCLPSRTMEMSRPKLC